ncbi:AAA family ATPase [Candidatus Spongiihabitans sp.]|uniref:AAA family ATPase n=1 Tax=Candidatus Spongiihabitans sp. TaxID=3101308 RepID=UPI003C6FF057
MADNPYRPGAAHAPPYLAGREAEQREFSRLLKQTPVLENLVLTGIRGIGKTVLMREALRKDAAENGWLWVGSDISEAASVSENHLVRRLLTDLNTFSADWEYSSSERYPLGFTEVAEHQTIHFDYQTMMTLFKREPGLSSDKIKRILLVAWELMQKHMPDKKGIIFAWDEAQNLADRSEVDQYPLGVLLDVFSSLQSQGVPFMLLLTGLPTLFPKLVDSRTYAERMFRVMTLDNLNYDESREAIAKPLDKVPEQIKNFFNSFSDDIYDLTKGYPYFIQFWCRELYDYLAGTRPDVDEDGAEAEVMERISRKLDMDFFEARWARLTDRQRDLLSIIAQLENSSGEFTVQEIVEGSKRTEQAFSSSHANQMLNSLFAKGLIFKNRHGKYVLAVPLLDQYIRRRITGDDTHKENDHD